MGTTQTIGTARPAFRRAPEQKREQLLAAARALFSSQGYDQTSTVQIAARAGVSEGILFHHFGSKGGLFAQLAEQFAVDAAAATMPAQSDQTTEESVVRSAFDFSDRDPDLYRVLSEDGPKLRDFDVAKYSDIVISQIERNLDKGMREGRVRLGNARVMAELHLAVVDGAYRAWRKSGKAALREVYILEAIHAMQAMLQPAKASRRRNEK